MSDNESVTTEGGTRCPVCGAKAKPALDLNLYVLWSCADCGCWSSDALDRGAETSFQPSDYFENAAADRDKWLELPRRMGDSAAEVESVLDIGCGNGYHCWRMLGAGAADVIGIDPTPLFTLQFKAINHYLRQPRIHVLPMTLEAMLEHLPVFDTVFSMGVLYHRRDPIAHLLSLKNKLRVGGQLVLETLVIDGDEYAVIEPNGRYARMGNVWQLPSPGLAEQWLKRAGFEQTEIVDINTTSVEEQRSTPWMTFHSLAEFLDPNDTSLTIEGFPAPRRAILTAVKTR